MKAYKCDICKNLFEEYSKSDNIDYYLKSKKMKDKDGTPVTNGLITIRIAGDILDICPDCRKAICDFINERVTDK